ncbi:Gldg family protein [Faecalibacterium sp. An192]|uniref:Gldg family protein n=1 Tax=Faecalibacterium sp. An192 TaxID=1965581 RepID=UPI000B37832E|nr:Gldg family protein [Faecalibacterium sp. An192]OUP29730.1 ABC transporter [Faecalibacterium sp. An192]
MNKESKLRRLFAAPADGGRIFRNGLYSTAILAAAVVLVILINLIVQAIPTTYTEFDLSEGGLYTLSDTSVQVAEGLTQDVTIYYLCETGSEDAIITRLLDQYAASSSHIHWEQKDPALYPTFASQYGAEQVSGGSLILDAGTGSDVLDAVDFYVYDYSDYYNYSVRFDGEQQITSSLYRLTSGEVSQAYYTTNHGERPLSDTLVDALEAQNIQPQELNLLSSTIPEDCDLLIINCPASDFTGPEGAVDEIGMLEEYLAAGGKVLLTTDAYYSTPNLDAVMAEFGLSRVDGLIVEGDANHSLYGYSYYLLPDYAITTESTALDGLDTSAYLLLQMAQGIQITQNNSVTAEPLLTTSSAAYSKTAGYEMTTTDKEEGDIDGPFNLAVWAQNDTTGAQVIWVGCSNMDDDTLYMSVPGNCDFLVGCAASLTGQSSDILIDAKALEADQLTIPAGTATVVGLVFLLAVPAGLLIAGAVVTIRRRRR